MIPMELAERLVRTSRRPRGLHGGFIALLGLGLLLGGIYARREELAHMGVPAWIWPQVIMLVLIGVMFRTGLRQRKQARLMLAAFESLQLQEWDKARELLLRLLARPIRHAAARTEALMGLAGLAEIGHSYDVSQRIYESILSEATANPVQLLMARMTLAAAMLRTGQTTDAVDLIDRLGRTSLPDSLKAHVELITLFREVVMGQADAAVDKADYRRGLFRDHLGTRAGYGYALLAAAYDRASQPDIAQRCWQEATLLIKAKTLVERFRELAPMAGRYLATEHVL